MAVAAATARRTDIGVKPNVAGANSGSCSDHGVVNFALRPGVRKRP